jgi:hexosaminidase
MKRILHFLLFAGICLSNLSQGYAQQAVQLIPIPVKIEQRSGNFQLTNLTPILVSQGNAEAKGVADFLASTLKVATGFEPKVGNLSGNSGIQLILNNKSEAEIGIEGYKLEVSAENVKITANKPAGLFNGIQTLIQLLPKEIESPKIVSQIWNIPFVSITDYPRFGWRGLMFDVSRHFFPKEHVKKYIDQMVKYKLNVFHWHLTDDEGWRIEIKKYPKLTQVGAWRVERFGTWGDREAPKDGEKTPVGGFYTQEDIKEIVKYAQERFITILPEIDVPGHSSALLASYPELSCTKDPSIKVSPGYKFAEWFGNGTFKMLIDNTLNPSDEKVYEFLDGVFTEVAALFPGAYIHMGGDECYHGYWEKDPGCQALMKKMKMQKVEELQSYFVKRIEKIVKSKGKKLIGWDEILEGGLAPEAAVMSWRGMKGGIEAAKMKHPVVMSPTTYFYLDYMQGDEALEPKVYATALLSNCYAFEPVPEGVDIQYILGGQANLWTEKVPTLRHAEYMTYPRALALAEVLWSPKEKRNWDDFIKRMEAQFERFDMAEVNYSRSAFNPILKPKRTEEDKMLLEIKTEINGLDIFYTLDNTFPDAFTSKYTQPIELPKGTDWVKVITYRNGKPVGRLITISVKDLEKRLPKKQ